jgi:hypothetical protein
MMLSAIGMASCKKSADSTSTSSQETSTSQKDTTSTSTNVKVGELQLSLAKSVARIGDTVEATVKFQPTNATNKEFTLASSDETIAKIVDGKISCLARGKVTITARSSENPLKKSSADLSVLGTDDQGRAENVFEAEEANIVASEGSLISTGTTDDQRVSGTGVVGSLSAGDHLIWGIHADKADSNSSLHVKMMGPSGWGGYWNSIDFTFADWFTFKVNGKTVDTEDLQVAGTYNNLGSADYFNVQDVTIGGIALNQGDNVISLAVTDRYNTAASYSDDKGFSGPISCLGNIDNITVYTTADLTYVPNTVEVQDADPDIAFTASKMEAEAANTRVYENETTPKADLGSATSAELKEDMNVLFGINSKKAIKAKIRLHMATPYKDATAALKDVALGDIAEVTLDGKDIDISNATLAANGAAAGTKDAYCDVETGFVTLPEGKASIGLLMRNGLGYSYLGALDYIEILYFGNAEAPAAVLADKPAPKATVKFEAEAATTKRVGYDALEAGATGVDLKGTTKVEADKYNGKYETTKVIFGIDSSENTYANLTLRMSSPYVTEGSSEAKDWNNNTITSIGVGSLGDLWVNGVMVSTPMALTLNGKKNNYQDLKTPGQIHLNKGKNRIVWEPCNYSNNTFAYLGGMDSITVSATSVMTPYEVNMWTDRNTYFDSTKKEPIYVTTDSVTTEGSSWVGVYHEEDVVNNKDHAGCLYYYYPQGDSLNTPVDITKQNPNGERHLIDGLPKGSAPDGVTYSSDDGNGYGAFKISYFAAGDYDATDTIYISVWNDVDNGYGGYVTPTAA